MPQHRKKQKRRRIPRISGTALRHLVPNMITLAATCTGLTGIRFALQEQWEAAVVAILTAAILDALDGRMARLLKASSNFGEQLDSLSDFVAFGVCPAMIMWLWSLDSLGGAGWVVALFFAICAGLRLARFNSRLGTLPPYAYNYFQGIPAPAGASLSLFPLVLHMALEGTHPIPDYGVMIWIIVMALLMVSEIPTYAFKNLRLSSRMTLPFMAGFFLLLTALVEIPWIILSGVAIAYIATFPVSFFNYMRLKAEAERLQAENKKLPKEAGAETGVETGTIREDESGDGTKSGDL